MLKSYFEDNKTRFFTFILTALAFCIFAKIGGCRWLFIFIGLIFAAGLFALFTFDDYKRFADKHNRLCDAIKNLKNVPEFGGIIDEDYLAIIEAVRKSCTQATSKAKRERNALYNYFSGWYEKNTEIRKSGDELLIELNYTALHNYMLALSGGFDMQDISVDEIVRDCVMKYNAHFMNKKIGIGVKKIGLYANTDPCALKYVIEQLLADCLLRTERGGVKLYADKSGENALIIEDSSDNAFTSEELFAVKNTGVHTALAVCRALGINCESASQPGRTAFKLQFPS